MVGTGEPSGNSLASPSNSAFIRVSQRPAKKPDMNAAHEILTHSNYDADDYAYLVAKGWSDEEILARWTAEAAHGQGPCRWESEGARAKLAAVTSRPQKMLAGRD